MYNKLFKIRKNLPVPPRHLFNVFTGSNDLCEFFFVLKSLFSWMGLNKAKDAQDVFAYEQAFASKVGKRFGVSFGAGRHALYAGLKVLGIGPGDEVIIPAFTCVVVPNAIKYLGAKPVYVDINPKDFNIDVNLIEAKITKATKIIYAQHTFGFPCALKVINQLAQKYNLIVVEDSAHSLGLKVEGNSNFAFYSTDHSKVINTMVGGMLVTDDEPFYRKLKDYQGNTTEIPVFHTKRILLKFLFEYSFYSPWLLWIGHSLGILFDKLNFFYIFRDEGFIQKPKRYPLKMPAPLCRLGLMQLRKLDANVLHRRKVFSILQGEHSKIGFSEAEIQQSTPIRFSILTKDKDLFIRQMKRYSLDLGIWFTSVTHGRNNDLHCVDYTRGECPVAEMVVDMIVNVPTHERISLELARKIRKIVRNFA